MFGCTKILEVRVAISTFTDNALVHKVTTMQFNFSIDPVIKVTLTRRQMDSPSDKGSGTLFFFFPYAGFTSRTL